MSKLDSNPTLALHLDENRPFTYAHLLKFERPTKEWVPTNSGIIKSTKYTKYAYLTDASYTIGFDDGSTYTDTDVSPIQENVSNGFQTYHRNKLISVSSIQESAENKVSSLNIELDANALDAALYSQDLTFSVSGNDFLITASESFSDAGFSEGDLIYLVADLISSPVASHNFQRFRIDSFRNNGLTIKVLEEDYALDSGTWAESGETYDILQNSSELTAITQDQATTNFVNRKVFVYKAFFYEDEPDVFIGSPVLLFSGIVASARYNENPEGSAKINWTCKSHWGDFQQVRGRYGSDEFHRALNINGMPDPAATLRPEYAYDKGFQHANNAINLIAKYTTQETRFKEEWRNKLLGTKKLKEYTVDVENEVDLRFNLNAGYIPLVYGVRRIGGNPIFVDTLANDAGKIYLAETLCEGPIQGIFNIYIDDQPLVCISQPDYDVRNRAGANYSTEVDIPCFGNAANGVVLSGADITNYASNAVNVSSCIEEAQAYGDALGNESFSEARLVSNVIADCRDRQEQYNTTSGSYTVDNITTSGSGLQHNAGLNFSTPTNTTVEFKAGLSDQKASSSLSQLASTNSFKIQSDYFKTTTPGDYWGGSHRLLDTAYTVSKYDITSEQSSIPELDYVVKGKLVNAYNYDGSFGHIGDQSEDHTNFALGDTVTIKNSLGTVLASNVQIIDKWTIYGSTISERYRFRWNLTAQQEQDIVDAKKFYMEDGSTNTWTMSTYDYKWEDVTFTVLHELKEEVTAVTSTASQSISVTTSGPKVTDAVTETNSKTHARVVNSKPIAPARDGGNDAPPGRLDTDLTDSSRTGESSPTSPTEVNLTDNLTSDLDEVVSDPNTTTYVVVTNQIQLADVSELSNVDDSYVGLTLQLTTRDQTGNVLVLERTITDFDAGTNILTFTPDLQTEQVPVAGDLVKILGNEEGKDLRSTSNFALMLLDYITNKRYGAGLDSTQINLDSFLNSARLCDTQSDISIYAEATGSISVGDIFQYNPAGGFKWQGTVKSVKLDSRASSPDRYLITFTDCIGKLTYKYNKYRTRYIDDIIWDDYTSGNIYRVTSQGTQSTSPANNATALDSTQFFSISSGGTDLRIYGQSGNPVTYSLYDSDFVTYWKYIGWEGPEQRWVTRHQGNFSIDTSQPVFNVIGSLLDHFNGILSFVDGKFKLDVETKVDSDKDLLWNFQDTNLSWTGVSGTTLINTEEYLSVQKNGSISRIRKEGLSFRGSTNTIVRARIRIPIVFQTDQITLRYSTNSHGFSGSYTKTLTGAGLPGQWTIYTFDMSNLTNGGTDWEDSFITGLEIEYPDWDFEVDWISVGSSVRVIEQEDIIGKVTLDDQGLSKAYNSISASITDPESNFNSRTVSFFNSEYLKQDRGVVRSGSFKLEGITNYYNARLAVEQTLNRSRYARKITFTMRPIGLALSPGQIIRFKYPRFGWDTGKYFRIESLNYSKDCLVNVTALEHNDSVYLIESAKPNRFTVVNDQEITVRQPDPPVNLYATSANNSPDDEQVNQITLTFDKPASIGSVGIMAHSFDIYRSTTNDPNTAEVIGVVPGGRKLEFIDILLPSVQTTYYYWVKTKAFTTLQTTRRTDSGKYYFSDFSTGTSGTTIGRFNSAFVNLYKRTTTNVSPAVPTNTPHIYNYDTGSITPAPDNSWTTTIPSAGGEYLWQLQVNVKSLTNTGDITSWGTASRLAQDGAAGADAKTAILTANKYVVLFDYQNNESPETQITLTAEHTNFTSPVYRFSKDGVTVRDWAAGNTYDIPDYDTGSPDRKEPGPGETHSYKVEIAENSGGAPTPIAFDTVSIYGIQSGAPGIDAITVIVSNEAHSIPVDNSGSASYTASGTTITVYEGASVLAYDGVGTSAGTWKITSQTGSNIEPGSPIVDSGNYATVPDHTNMSATLATVTYLIEGTRNNGVTFSLTKVQSLAQSVEGQDGGTANIVFLRSSSEPDVPSDSSGVPSSPVQWYDTPPSGTDILWASSGNKAIGSSVFDWGSPFQIEGASVAEVYVFRKDTSVPGTPTNGSYNFVTSTLTAPTTPAAWATEPAALVNHNDTVYVSVGLFTGAATETSATTTWSTPVVYAKKTDGEKNALIYTYKRSASAPTDNPGAVTVDLTTGLITTATLANSWEKTIPAGTDPLYTCTVSVSSTDNTVNVAANDWNAAAPLSKDGLNNAQVTIYQGTSSNSPPSAGNNGGKPEGNTTYTFSTKSISLPTAANGWQTTLPTSSNYVWAITATASAYGNTDTIADSEWSAISLIAQKGSNNALVTIYQKTSTLNAPSAGNNNGLPEGNTTYTFGTGALGFTTANGWASSITNAGSGAYVWSSQATVSSQGGTGTIAAGDWSPASLIGTKGDVGSPGLTAVQGYLYYEKTTANAPSAPTGTTYTISSGVVSGSGINDAGTTNVWRNSPRPQDPTSTNTHYTIRYYGTQANSSDTTITVTYSGVVQYTNFTGVVTFSGGTFSQGSTNITSIDGGNISTGTITADQISVTATSLINSPTQSKNIYGWGGVDTEGNDNSGSFVTLSNQYSGDYGLAITNDGNVGVRSDTFTVDHDQIYVVQGRIVQQNTTGGTIYIGLSGYTSPTAGTSIDGGNAQGTESWTPYTVSGTNELTRTAGSNNSNFYFLGKNNVTSSLPFRFYIVGANRDISEANQHIEISGSNVEYQPYVKLRPLTTDMAVRVLNWNNGATTRVVFLEDFSIQEQNSGTIVATNIIANNIESITSSTGQLTVDSDGHIKGGQTAYDTGTGFFLGYDSTDYKFSIGDADRALLWDGNKLNIRGDNVSFRNAGQTVYDSNSKFGPSINSSVIDLSSNTDYVYFDNKFDQNLTLFASFYAGPLTSGTISGLTNAQNAIMSQISLQIQYAPNNSGTPGTWANFGSAGVASKKFTSSAQLVGNYYVKVTDLGSGNYRADLATVSQAATDGTGLGYSEFVYGITDDNYYMTKRAVEYRFPKGQYFFRVVVTVTDGTYTPYPSTASPSVTNNRRLSFPNAITYTDSDFGTSAVSIGNDFSYFTSVNDNQTLIDGGSLSLMPPEENATSNKYAGIFIGGRGETSDPNSIQPLGGIWFYEGMDDMGQGAGSLGNPDYAIYMPPEGGNLLIGGNVNFNNNVDVDGTLSINGVTVNAGAVTGPAGSNTQIQYNNNGVLGASSALTFTSGTSTLTATNATVTGTLIANTIDTDIIYFGTTTSNNADAIRYDDGEIASSGGIYHFMADQSPDTSGTAAIRINHLLAGDYSGNTIAKPSQHGWARLGTQTASNGGLEFLSSISGNGYGWRITNPDNGSGDVPLLIQNRINTSPWSTVATFEANKTLALESDLNVGSGKIITKHKAFDVLTIDHTSTPTQYLITTNIPYTDGSQMPTIKIQGFAYGIGRTVDLTIVYYIYGGNFTSYSASSSGGWTPTISLAQNASGKVVIHLDGGHYYTKMTVSLESGVGMMSFADGWLEGWTWSDSACPATNKVTVPYFNSASTTFLTGSNSNPLLDLFGSAGQNYQRFLTNTAANSSMGTTLWQRDTDLEPRIEMLGQQYSTGSRWRISSKSTDDSPAQTARIRFQVNEKGTVQVYSSSLIGGSTGPHYEFWANRAGMTIGVSMLSPTHDLELGTMSSTNLVSFAGLETTGLGAAWNEVTPGLTKGKIHIEAGSTSNDYGGALTFGASDASNAQAGIYTRTDGQYGSKMYLATTDSYATGSRTALTIDSSGNISISRGALTVTNGGTAAINVISADSAESVISLYGSNQGTGRLFIGQSSTYGGGILYNGDGNPAFGGSLSDYITFYRTNNGTSDWTARYYYASNDWSFRGNITAYASDYRLKTNIKNISSPLKKLNKLNGVEFDWIEEAESLGFLPSQSHETGVIAQEVREVIPDAVVAAPFDDNYLTVQKEKIIPLLIEAIKEQQKQIEELKKLIKEK